MHGAEWQADQFQQHRDHLEAVAYRMLGSSAEAEDAVQEAWLRLERAEPDSIENLRGWLTTVVSRVCIDMLRVRRARREEPDDGILDIASAGEGSDPEGDALLGESVALALLVVLETLTPAERVAFVLHDLFAVPFDEIAPIVERSPEAARQLASRARRRVRGAGPPGDPDAAAQRRVVAAFLAASRAGDFEGLLAVLDPDAVFRADPGPFRGLVAPRVSGGVEVARYAARQGPRFARACHPALVAGRPGLVIGRPGRPLGAVVFTLAGERVRELELVLDRRRLRALG